MAVETLNQSPIVWSQVALSVPNRNAPQCRERWVNVLDQNLNTNQFTHDEATKLMDICKEYESKGIEYSLYVSFHIYTITRGECIMCTRLSIIAVTIVQCTGATNMWVGGWMPCVVCVCVCEELISPASTAACTCLIVTFGLTLH